MLLSRGSVAQLMTGIAIPLDESSGLATDARFGHLLGASGAENRDEEDGIHEKSDGAALQELQVLHSSQGTTTGQALVQA